MSLIEFFPLKVDVFPLGTQEPLTVNLDVPFNWYSLYFAAICFGFSRLVYTLFCPDFLRRYNTAAEAISDGVTVLILKDKAAEYLERFQNRRVHPLSDEGVAIHHLITALLGPNNLVEDKFKREERGKYSEIDDFASLVAGAHLTESASTSTYVVGIKENDFNTQFKHVSQNLPIWRLIELQNLSLTWVRMVTTVSVAMGFIFIAIPFIQGLIAVCSKYFAL